MEVNELKRELTRLIQLQETYSENALVQCRLSLRYHVEATNLLERYGNQLQEQKYYYRAQTYTRAADYLLQANLPEVAIDAYFRSLIFQGNFVMFDKGKEKLLVMLGIMACYDRLSEKDMIEMMYADLNAQMQEVAVDYQIIWQQAMWKLQNKYQLDLGIKQSDQPLDTTWLKKYFPS